MPDIDTLRDIAARLNKADGADRWLDAAIAKAFTTDKERDIPLCAGIYGIGAFTGSLDDIMRLRKQEYPTLVINLCLTADGLAQVRESFDSECEDIEFAHQKAAPPALAVGRVLMMALIAKEEVAEKAS